MLVWIGEVGVMNLITIKYKARISDHVLNNTMCYITHIIDRDSLKTISFEYKKIEDQACDLSKIR